MQDVYNIDGRNIAVGRVESGVITKKEQIKILPSQAIAKINSIEDFTKTRGVARSQESIGIVVEDNILLKRGDVICP